jgi:DNA integrity scanning protein DisA with diadenylate cyclase activity
MIWGGKFWLHLVDVAICAFVLRVILGWLWAFPRLLRLLITLAVIVAFVALIVLLELPFAGMLILVLIVPATIIIFLSFLPELSRVYQTAIRGNLFRTRVIQSEETVTELAETFEQLAGERKGAILVFPNQQDAESLISGGEDIDASVKRTILRSLFDPHCPRHDGAAVIRNGRIIKIGGVLPLASAEGAEAKLGTRHLAAIGLTERCDADVFVVSEERGVVSHVREGKLRELHPPTKEVLEDQLFDIFGVRRDQAQERRAAVWSVALWGIALAVAVAGSFTVQVLRERYFVEPLVQTGADARLQFTEVPRNYYVDGLASQSCTLQVRGPRNLDIPRALTVNIDLSRTAPGAVAINLSPDMVRGLPKEIEVLSIVPSRINFVLEKSRSMEIPVDVSAFNGLPRSLVISSYEVVPQRIQATVRDRNWKTTDRLRTLPIDLSWVTDPGQIVLNEPLNIPASIEPVPGVSRNVRITVEISSRQESRKK